MFGHKVKIEAALYRRLTKVAEAAGYSSTEEFILHVIEKTAAAVEDAEGEDEIRKRLQGLGYLE
jgi:hypothetical protein